MTAELWIVGGSNGAGKTTAVSTRELRERLKRVEFLNPDAVTLTKLLARGYDGFEDPPDDELRTLFLESAVETEERMASILAGGGRCGIETVLSSDKYKPHVERLNESGGLFFLAYVSVRSADIAVRRVAGRVKEGGHGVPEEKIRSRFMRSHELLKWFLPRAAGAYVYDNSDATSPDGPRLVAKIVRGEFVKRDASADIAPELTAALDAVAAGGPG